GRIFGLDHGPEYRPVDPEPAVQWATGWGGDGLRAADRRPEASRPERPAATQLWLRSDEDGGRRGLQSGQVPPRSTVRPAGRAASEPARRAGIGPRHRSGEQCAGEFRPREE